VSFIFIPYFREIGKRKHSTFNRFYSSNIKINSKILIFFDKVKSFFMNITTLIHAIKIKGVKGAREIKNR